VSAGSSGAGEFGSDVGQVFKKFAEADESEPTRFFQFYM
jgi:hypothetical protein